MPKAPDTRGAQLRAPSSPRDQQLPCPCAPLLFWGQWHIPTASGLVAWWPCTAVPLSHDIVSRGDTALVLLPREQQLHVCLHGLLSAQLLALLHLEPCNWPGVKCCLCFTVTWTVSSAGFYFLEQNLLFQHQKLKVKYITVLAFSPRKVHCAPDCAHCKHCHPPKNQHRAGNVERERPVWAQSCSSLASQHQGRVAGPHRQLQPPLQTMLLLHQLPECLSCGFISYDLKGWW